MFGVGGLQQGDRRTLRFQRSSEHHLATTSPARRRGQTAAASSQQQGLQQQQETSAYMVLRAQQLITQLMPTLVGDQVPIAAEALGQLQSWTRGLWGHDIQLVGDSATDSVSSLMDTVPWNPPQPTRGQAEEGHPPGKVQAELWTPAGRQSRGHHGDCSLDSVDMPGTETEDEAFGLERRRRSATTPATRTAAPTESGEGENNEARGRSEYSSHRRRRLHAAMSDN